MRWVYRIFMVCGLLAGAAHSLYTDKAITAFRVPDGKIVVDGKPDSVWKEIAAKGAQGYSRILFNDPAKIVLLTDSISIRNAPPEDYIAVPSAGSVTMLSAYDGGFLYFFFIVKENNRFNPAASCALPDIWRAHAVDVFVDPAAWNETLYAAYFSADAGEVSYGTSSRTFQVAKPAWPGETREYYRDRTAGNRFELRNNIGSLVGISATRTAADLNTIGVELKIPVSQDFLPAGAYEGKSMFISWGYNHYPEAGRSSCDSAPIAYRWAKHYKSYSGSQQKPPGWKPGDSTHYDPLRSRDGWGRFNLSREMVLGNACRPGLADTAWDLETWASLCHSAVSTTLTPPLRRSRLVLPEALGAPGNGADPWRDLRDIKGRLVPGLSPRVQVRTGPAEPLPERGEDAGPRVN